MDRNLVRFGLIAIFLLIVFAAFQLCPPQKTLKPGLDLAGGTSLVYEIDITGLENDEIDNLAQRLIPILKKRIDPGNIQNIVMRPLGDTRIEIQVPLASPETYTKRKAFDDALQAIAAENINLAIIKRSLGKTEAERTKEFAEFAGESESRLQILSNLAEAYDNRKAVQTERDTAKAELDLIAAYFKEADIPQNTLMQIAVDSGKVDPNSLEKSIEAVAGQMPDAEKAREKIQDYSVAYAKWALAVNELTAPETGLNALYRDVESLLKNFNLGTDTITEVLEMPAGSRKRGELIEGFIAAFPSRSEEIKNLVAVFEDYRPLRGRIDGPEDVKRMLKGAGVLEFRVLPKMDDGKTGRNEVLAYIDALKVKGPKLASDSRYVWIEIEDFEDGKWRPSDRNQIVVGSFAEKFYVLASNQKNECLLKYSQQKAWKLEKAKATADQMGRRAIEFDFDEVGSKYFYNLTKDNLTGHYALSLTGRPFQHQTSRAQFEDAE